MNDENYFSVPLKAIVPSFKIPFNIYLFINNHFILYRRKDDALEEEIYFRLQMKKIKFLFIKVEEKNEYEKYEKRVNRIDSAIEEAVASPLGHLKTSIESKLEEEIERNDIEKNIESISDLAESSAKDLVAELKKKSYSIKLLSHLTAHSNGIYSHCTNVSTLSIHLAMKLGYHQDHVLENIGSAGLLHDIGKIKLNNDLLNKSFNKYTPEETKLLRKHPEVGRGLLLAVTASPEEVRLIVYQHHEYHDGSGYPNKIRGSKIYELTKIISIVNTFEHLFQGMKTRDDFSVQQVISCMTSKNIASRFDPKTLNKCLDTLRDSVK